MRLKDQQQQKERRRQRVRAKVSGTAERPRLSVAKSNRSMYVQLIDDDSAKTLVGLDLRRVAGSNTVESAKILGLELAKQAKAKRISQAVFDRGSHRYMGQVKAVADGAREGGLKF